MADFDPVSYIMGAKAGGGGGGSSSLVGLTDVDITNPTNGQTLVYNATSGKWENATASGGGGLIVHHTHDEQTGKYTLDKTWQEIADALLHGPVVRVDHEEVDYSRYVSIPVNYVEVYQSEYTVSFTDYSNYKTDSANGYPYYIPD